MLHEQIEVVRNGGEPMNVFRDPQANDRMELTIPGFQESPVVPLTQGGRSSATGYYRANFHKVSKGGWLYLEDDADRYCPDRALLLDLFRKSEAVWNARMAANRPASVTSS